jgi:hypothetical protein
VWDSCIQHDSNSHMFGNQIIPWYFRKQSRNRHASLRNCQSLRCGKKECRECLNLPSKKLSPPLHWDSRNSFSKRNIWIETSLWLSLGSLVKPEGTGVRRKCSEFVSRSVRIPGVFSRHISYGTWASGKATYICSHNRGEIVFRGPELEVLCGRLYC